MKTPDRLVKEVLRGQWSYGEKRRKRLLAAGYSYIEIQSLVNLRYNQLPVKASIDELAQEVIDGRWGAGEERKARFKAAGQNYTVVQDRVNQMFSSNAPKPSYETGTAITAKGIDISYYQGNVNFVQAKNGGVQFVILREGYGTKIDSKFLTYAAAAQSANMPIHAVYHFCYAKTEAEALAEAKICLENVKKAGLDKSTIIFYDFEYDTVNSAAQKGIALGKDQCISFTRIFCDYIQKQGYPAGIYTNLDYSIRMYDEDTLNKYILWIAAYNNTGIAPRKCAYWQWSGSGRAPGISVAVDQDNCYLINPKL